MNDVTGYWILRCENQVLAVHGETPGKTFPLAEAGVFGSPDQALRVGQWQGRPCYAADVATVPAGLDGELTAVRALYGAAGAEAFALAGRATQLLDWKKNHRFCGRCATPTMMRSTEFAMECPSCGLLAYPRISPAVMVLVARGDELLLARIFGPVCSVRWPGLSRRVKRSSNVLSVKCARRLASRLPISGISRVNRGLSQIR